MYEVKKRTFEAENHPKGSAERAKLNGDGLTSEYYHSYKYRLYHNGLWVRNFRTKSEAQAYADQLKLVTP